MKEKRAYEGFDSWKQEALHLLTLDWLEKTGLSTCIRDDGQGDWTPDDIAHLERQYFVTYFRPSLSTFRQLYLAGVTPKQFLDDRAGSLARIGMHWHAA